MPAQLLARCGGARLASGHAPRSLQTSVLGARKGHRVRLRDREEHRMPRHLQEWGGEVRLPGWLRRLLRRPAPAADTPERMHERQQPEEPTKTVFENVNRGVEFWN